MQAKIWTQWWRDTSCDFITVVVSLVKYKLNEKQLHTLINKIKHFVDAVLSHCVFACVVKLRFFFFFPKSNTILTFGQ